MERLDKKCVFSEKEKEYIKTKYLEGTSLEKLAKKFECCGATIRKKLKEMQIIKKQKCIICGKSFLAKSVSQKYCHHPCDYRDSERRRGVGLRYDYIKAIRRDFYRLIKSNPEKALLLQKQMEKEEGKKFRDMALDGITQKDEFKKMDKTYKKYKHLWKGEKTI